MHVFHRNTTMSICVVRSRRNICRSNSNSNSGEMISMFRKNYCNRILKRTRPGRIPTATLSSSSLSSLSSPVVPLNTNGRSVQSLPSCNNLRPSKESRFWDKKVSHFSVDGRHSFQFHEKVYIQQQQRIRTFSSADSSSDSSDKMNNKQRNHNFSRRQHFKSAGASHNESYDDAIAALPRNAQLQFDFFGEPVTFFGGSNDISDKKKEKRPDDTTNSNDNKNPTASIDNTTNAMAALDGFLLAVSTKGRTCTGGGTEQGLEMKAAHAAAISWAELLRHAKVWNYSNDDNDNVNNIQGSNSSEETRESEPKTEEINFNDKHSKNNKENSTGRFAPMLAVTAIAPVMVQGGYGYVQFLDRLLEHGDSLVPGMGPLQMIPLAETIIQRKDDPLLNERERQHIQALEYMMEYDHETALLVYLKILRTCPGDVLALSLAIDLANVLGDKRMALRAATSIASYWNERQGGYIEPSIPGYNIACSWQAVGLAVGGKREEAEYIAERTLNKDKRNTGAVTTWALAHIFDAEGRIAEGISYLANHDGIANYEGCGLLFFDCRLSGYGALYSIDREQRGRGLSAALRLYDQNFERILEYSGFSQGKAWTRPQRRAPIAWVQRENDGDRSKTANFLKNLLGTGKRNEEESFKNETQIVVRENLPPSLDFDQFDPSCEDVLTWLPPTPQLLAEATLTLFRLTLNGTLSVKDKRWDSLQNSWQTLLELQKNSDGNARTLEHFPLACLAASILLPVEETGGDQIGNGRMAYGLNLLGEMLNLGNQAYDDDEEETKDLEIVIADKEPDFWLPAKDGLREEWKKIVELLASALDGVDGHQTEKANRSLRFEPWDFESRPLIEHAICYAACRAGDTDSLSYARSVSSQGVTLRRSSPEEWWRYSIILGLLGDQVASENALANAVNVGSGQGQRG